MNPEIINIIRFAELLDFDDLLNITQLNKEFYSAYYCKETYPIQKSYLCNKRYKITFMDNFIYKQFRMYWCNFLYKFDDLRLLERYLQIHGYASDSRWLVHDTNKHGKICFCNMIHWYYQKTYRTGRGIVFGGGNGCVYLSSGISPLHMTIFLNATEKAKLFMRYMKDDWLDIKDKNNNTPLTIACYVGELEIVKLLINRGLALREEDIYYALNAPNVLEFIINERIIDINVDYIVEFLKTKYHDISYDKIWNALQKI